MSSSNAWLFEESASLVLLTNEQSLYVERLRSGWGSEIFYIPSTWLYRDARPEPSPPRVRFKDRQRFIFSLCVSPILHAIIEQDANEVLARPGVDQFCPDTTLCVRRAHDFTFQDDLTDPSAHCLELFLAGLLYSGSEPMAEYSVSSMFTGIPGCWMRRNPWGSCLKNSSEKSALVPVDFAVLLHQYGSSSHLQVDRDSNLQISSTHPALLVAVKGPSSWNSRDNPHSSTTFSDALRNLANHVRPSLETLLDGLHRREPEMSSLPESAIIFGIVYDSERLSIVAHSAVAIYDAIGRGNMSMGSPRYQYISQVVEDLEFPSRSSPQDRSWTYKRMKVLCALTVLRRHIHRLSAIWSDLPPPSSEVWDTADQYELAIMGPVCLRSQSVTVHSDDLCEDCLRDPCICEYLWQGSETESSSAEASTISNTEEERIRVWRAAVVTPGDVESANSSWAGEGSGVGSYSYVPTLPPMAFTFPLCIWSIERRDQASRYENARRSHVLNDIGRTFPKDLDLILPATFSTLKATESDMPGTQAHMLHQLYSYALFEIKRYMGCTLSIVPEDQYRDVISEHSAVDTYTDTNVYLNPFTEEDLRSLKQAILAITIYPAPVSYEVPMECLVVTVMQGFLELENCAVIRDADHRGRFRQPSGIVHSCESAVATEVLSPDLPADLAFIVLAVLPWDSRPIEVAQERLALRFESMLKLILYLHRAEIAAIAPSEDRSAVLPSWCCLLGAIYTRLGMIFVAHWPEWSAEAGRWQFASAIIDDHAKEEWFYFLEGHTSPIAVRLLRAQHHAAFVARQVRRLATERGRPLRDDILDIH